MKYNIVPDYKVKNGKRISRYWGFNIDSIEKQKNAKFVCEVAIRMKNGGWSEEPVAIFWQETPPDPSYSHYFGLFSRDDVVYITSGQQAVDEPLTAIVADNGDIVYSAYRHDFRYSPDQSAWIDGGRDYVRSGVKENGETFRFVSLTIEKDKFVVGDVVNSDLQ